MVNNFNEYMLDLIVEAVINKETTLMFSQRFKRILNKMEHPIADKLKYDSSNYDINFKFTYIDLDENGDDLVSFISVPKAAEHIADLFNLDTSKDVEVSRYYFFRQNTPDSPVYLKNRVSTSIGRLINKLYSKEFEASGQPGFDIESFTTLFKSYRKKKNGEFDLVKGGNISYWYHEDNYSDDADDDTSLGNSCMKYSDCEDYVQFYDLNPDKVSLLILKDIEEPDKIIGRALIWNLTEPKGRIFMDRIYVVDYVDEQLFKNYAIEKGWLYKKKQTYSNSEVIDPTGKCDEDTLLVVEGMKRNQFYPYMDSLNYYSSDLEILSNKEKFFDDYEYEDFYGDRYKKEKGITCHDLQNDGGGPGTMWSDYYKDYFICDDLTYCELGHQERRMDDTVFIPYYNEYATQEFFKHDIVKCDYYNEDEKDNRFVLKKDAIYLDLYDEYMTPNYEWEDLFVKDKEHKFIKKNNNN